MCFLVFTKNKGRVGLSLFLIREDNSPTTQVIIQGFILQSAYNYKLLKREIDLNSKLENFIVIPGRGLLMFLPSSLILQVDEFRNLRF